MKAKEKKTYTIGQLIAVIFLISWLLFCLMLQALGTYK
jgi:hypothetical protein